MNINFAHLVSVAIYNYMPNDFYLLQQFGNYTVFSMTTSVIFVRSKMFALKSYIMSKMMIAID